jgi:charged multivesicular body protein 3
MEEMLDDTLEGLDDPELEEEAEEEVDRVLFEITDGKLGVAGAGKELPVRRELFLALHCWVLTRAIEPQRC